MRVLKPQERLRLSALHLPPPRPPVSQSHDPCDHQPRPQPTKHSMPEYKPDPLGRKAAPAAAHTKAGKKNAQRAARRNNAQRAVGRGGGAAGVFGGYDSLYVDDSDETPESGDDSDSDEEASLSPASPARGAGAAARKAPPRGSPAKGPGGAERVGPAVYGNTLLMEDDPRLREVLKADDGDM